MYDIVDNITCIAVIVVLLLSITLQKIKSDKTTSRFRILARIVLGFLITDLICDLVDGKPNYTLLSYFVNVLDYLWIDGMIISFSAYLITLIGHVIKKWKYVMNPGVFFAYISMIVTVVLFFTGNLFIIDENGYFQELPLSVVSYILSFVILMLIMIVVIRNKKHFNTQQMVVILVYLLLPIIGGLAEMFTGIYVFSVIAITLSVLLIYTAIQSGIIDEFRVRESLLEEISNTDLLTQMNNRRAFYSCLQALDTQKNVGIIFCDINNLKYTNDTFGHTEGDKLIVHFSKLLSSIFDLNVIFRISGDEFVIIIPDINEEAFNEKVLELRNVIYNNNSIASLGSAYGVGASAQHLISESESNMYTNKKEYYNKNNTPRGDLLYR